MKEETNLWCSPRVLPLHSDNHINPLFNLKDHSTVSVLFLTLQTQAPSIFMVATLEKQILPCLLSHYIKESTGITNNEYK